MKGEAANMRKVRWGVMGTARIATQKVIPAMQSGQHCSVAAIASRDIEKARTAARQLQVLKAYGSYEELLADAEVDAVYIPLPNHLHVTWSIKALRAGKHVLCEKPIGLDAREAFELLDAFFVCAKHRPVPPAKMAVTTVNSNARFIGCNLPG